MTPQARPLDDVRVLDFGHYLAGPLVGMMLADLGADVVRVDPPGGPVWADPAFSMLSRGKRVIELDLKSDSGRVRVTDLASNADVLVENFRPGVMDRLGLGPSVLRASNSSLVYLSLPGFASNDPELAHLPAWEAVIGAVTGQFTDMGLNRRLMGVNPSFSPLGLASAYGASLGATAVLMALAARGRTGGEHIEVPLASALLEGLAYNAERIEDYPDRYKSPREVELDRREHVGDPFDMTFGDLSELLDPFYRTYACADGRGFYVVAGSVVAHPPRVLRALGLSDLLGELPSFSAYLDTAEWPDEWTLANYPVGDRDRARLADAMKEAFATRPAAEWERIFGEAQAPATMQRTTQEWLADEHALAAGLVLDVDDPDRGRMRQMGNVAWLADDPDAVSKRAARSVQEVEWTPRPAVTGSRSGGWLDGMKVLDLTNVIAGPTIGSTLARFGAEVTSVQPVIPSVDPWNTIVFGLHAHRGKESILLDPATGRGREALDRLIAESDVITFNGTDAQRDRFGLSPDRLAEIDPKLILVQLDAFGGPWRGPKSDDLGYDDLAQAATGVMLRFGGIDTPEEHAHFGTIDVLSGFCATVALGAALVRRSRTGQGGLARASLAAAGNLIQSQFMYDFDGRPPFDEPSGRDVLGWGPGYRCYEAADGWMFVAGPADGHLVASTIGAAVDQLASEFRRRPVSHWTSEFDSGSIAVVPLGSLMDTRDAALQRESEGTIDLVDATFRVIRHDEHPMGRWVDLVAPNAIRPEKAEITIPGPMPKYGQHTRSILERLGFDRPTIESMLASGDAGESWSERYLPE